MMLEKITMVIFVVMCTAITTKEVYTIYHIIERNKTHDELLREDIKAMVDGNYERCKDITEIAQKHFHDEVK